MTQENCPPKHYQFNPFDYDYHADPKSVYKLLRDHLPVNYNEKLDLYTLSRYEDVIKALKNDAIYSFCHSDTYEKFHPEYVEDLVGFFCHDAPEHNQYRQLTGRPFSPKKSDASTALVKQFADKYIGAAIEKAKQNGGKIEFMNDIAGPITMGVIGELMNIPEEDRANIRHWIDLTVARDNGSPVVQPESLSASENLLEYLYKLWSDREQAGADRNDITDHMIRMVASGRIPKKHGISFLWGLCYAGQESTAKMIGNAIYQAYLNNLGYVLHKSPELTGDFLDEVMRLDSPAQIVYRTMLEDDEWYGTTLKKGSRVALILGSADIDERVFGADAGQFRIGRAETDVVLTFGWGTHYCIGKHLGVLEVRLCLEQFFSRVSHYTLDLKNASRVHTSGVHGFTELPMQLIDYE